MSDLYMHFLWNGLKLKTNITTKIEFKYKLELKNLHFKKMCVKIAKSSYFGYINKAISLDQEIVLDLDNSTKATSNMF